MMKFIKWIRINCRKNLEKNKNLQDYRLRLKERDRIKDTLFDQLDLIFKIEN